jgi:hypothetical protein
MPEFEMSLTPSDRAGDALDRLGTRFPEIDVVGRYRSIDAADELWVCRAPSVTHVERWAAEAELHITGIRRLAEP